jgi:hypothetical protein
MANGRRSQLTHHEVDKLNRKHRQNDCSRVVAKGRLIDADPTFEFLDTRRNLNLPQRSHFKTADVRVADADNFSSGPSARA